MADSLFLLLKKAHAEGILPKHMQKYRHCPFIDFEWQGQKLKIFKYYKTATETLEHIYIVYLLGESGTINRTFVTEKTVQLTQESPMHLLCEKGKNGSHKTYPYGWKTDEISVKSLKEFILEILEQEVEPSAASFPNQVETNRKAKNKKKNHKEKR